MLDDLERIEKIDGGKMRKILFDFPLQCQRAVQMGKELKIPQKFFERKDKIIICGLGGSAIGGDILKTLLSPNLEMPILVNRNYTLPKLVDERTLIFAVSYSGDTEETLSAYKEAKRRESSLISICSGGKLKSLSQKDGVPCVVIPSGMPPRTALGYLLMPMLKILEKSGWVKEENWGELFSTLSYIRDRCAPEVPSQKNFAKLLSCELLGKTPLIYGVEGKTDVVAHRLKTQFNENSKILAFWDVIPELSHNEVVGWGEGRLDLLSQFYPLFIRDKEEGKRIEQRIKLIQSLMRKKSIRWKEIWTEGKNLLTRILSSIHMGDWISFYLAILQRIDPTPVRTIELLKRELSNLH